jgi:hypothetical protein
MQSSPAATPQAYENLLLPIPSSSSLSNEVTDISPITAFTREYCTRETAWALG